MTLTLITDSMATGKQKTLMTSGNNERVQSIDVLRSLALVGMVLVHFMVYFGDSKAKDSLLYFSFNHILGDWGAAAFLLMMGMSQVLSAHRWALDNTQLLRRATIRGAYEFGMGIAMLALSWGPSKIWRWDILTLMGVSTLTVFACRFLSSWCVVASCLAVALATPMLRSAIDFASLWGGAAVQVPVISTYLPGILMDPASEFKVIWHPKDILLGFLLTGEFPFFPWALFPPIGFILGRRIVGAQLREDLPILTIIGVLMVFLGLGGAYASLFQPGSSSVSDHLCALSFYPDSFTMVLYQIGMALLAFCFLYHAFDVRRGTPSGGSVFQTLCFRTSRFSLTFYFLHYLIIGWPLQITSRISGQDAAAAGLMGATQALIAGVAAVMALETILMFLEKGGGAHSLEGLLVVITEKLVPQQSPDTTIADSGSEADDLQC
jgi:uncharacterized membrane protein